MKPTRRWLLGAAVAIGALSGLVFAGCNDEGGGDENTAVISAIDILDKAGLHDIATAINEDGEIPATARTTALRMQTLVLLTEWPNELQAEATALAAVFAEMAKALDGANPEITAAGAAAEKAHDAEHDFSGRVWAHLQEEAGTTAAEDGHKD